MVEIGLFLAVVFFASAFLILAVTKSIKKSLIGVALLTFISLTVIVGFAIMMLLAMQNAMNPY